MSLEKNKGIIKKTLTTMRNEVLSFINTLSEDQMNVTMKDDDDEAWTIFEVIKHLHLAESGTIDLMENIKHGGTGVSDNFDLKKYNIGRVKRLEEKNLKNLIKLLKTSRERLLTFMDRLNEEDLGKKGQMVPKVTLSIEQMLGVISNHEKYHLNKCKSSLQR